MLIVFSRWWNESEMVYVVKGGVSDEVVSVTGCVGVSGVAAVDS